MFFCTLLKISKESYKCFRVQDAWSLAESRGIERKTTLQKLEDATLLHTILHSGERNCYSEESEYNPIPSLDTEWITIKVTEVSIMYPMVHKVHNYMVYS